MAHTAHSDPEMMDETADSREVVAKKVDQVVQWIRESKHLVVFTGAGVSTSAGIPDFRGPDGVWTLKAQGRQRKGPTTSTLKAFPTVCHMSLVELQNKGILKYLISQNCDGLHKRSGMLPDRISELHGNSNIEYCEACGFEYLRDDYAHRLVRGRDHYTGRHCVVPLPEGSEDGSGGVCNGRLMESTIDFGQNLPERPLQLAEEHSNKADLHIVFGSSLTVSPACTMPKKTRKKGGRLVIVNLQKTPLYDLANLNIRARCDEVMAAIMAKLNLSIPRWVLKREIVLNCQSNSQECILSLQGVDPAKIHLPATVIKNAIFQLPKKVPGIQKAEALTDREPFRFRIKYQEGKEQKEEIPLTVVLKWRGHYDEPDVSFKFPLLLGTNNIVRYTLGYTPSLGTWEMKSVQVSDTERKAWSPLMHKLMGSNIFIEEKKQSIWIPELKNNCIIAYENDLKDDDEMDTIEGRQHPPALWTASTVYRNNKDQMLMYVFGGAPVVKTKVPTGINAYNLNTKSWETIRLDEAKVPFVTEERWGHTATVCPEGSSNIYLIGGWDNRCQYGDVMLFDAKTNKLKRLETGGIECRAGHSAVCVGNSIYVFGGAICKGGPYTFYNDLQIFDTKTNKWTELKVKERPAPRSQHSSLALGDTHLVIIGGYTGGSLLDDVWCFDLKESQWKRMTVTSEDKGPRGFAGLTKTDFRVRPSSHTSVLLKWNGGVATILVLGLSCSNQSYILYLRPKLGTMEWKPIKALSDGTSPTGHSYVSFPKPGGESFTVVSFGGILNEKGGEPGMGRTNAYIRMFDVV